MRRENPYWIHAQEIMRNTKPIVEVVDLLPPLPVAQEKEKFFRPVTNFKFEEKDNGEHIEIINRRNRFKRFQGSADTIEEAYREFETELEESYR